MTRRLGWGGVLALVFLLAFATLVVAVAAVGSALPLEHTTIVVEGEAFHLSELQGEHAAAVVVAVAAALLLALVIVAAAVVFALVAAALAVGVALLLVLMALAVAASPVLLLAWVVWYLARPAPRAHAAPGTATA